MDRHIFRRRFARQLTSLVIYFFVSTYTFSEILEPRLDRGLGIEKSPTTWNESIDQVYQKLISKSQIADLNIMLDRIKKFRSLIVSEISNSPFEIDIVAVILAESEGNPHARSHSGAAGLWQIMKNTRADYMQISELRDDRYDLVKSTKHALSLLKYYMAEFQDISWALAAYNAGENRVLRIIKANPGKSFFELSDEKKIPNETRYYVPKIIALSKILDNSLQSGIKILWEKDAAMSLVRIPKTISLRTLEIKLGLASDVLKFYNPEIRNDTINSDFKYYLKLPSDLVNSYDDIIKTQDLSPVYSSYTIKSGDNLYKISKNFGISISILKTLNPSLKETALQIGHTIKIPFQRGKV